MAIDFIQAPSNLVERVDGLKADQRMFILSPSRWRAFSQNCTLKWQSVAFGTGGIPCAIPDEPGVYCFSIENSNPLLPHDSYIVYVGIVGYKPNSPRTLRHRYVEYQKEAANVQRVKLCYILNKWQGHISFQFVSNPTISLEDLEKDLLEALVPLANQNDFNATLRQAVRALDS